MVKVNYKHWQTGEELFVVGTILTHVNEDSDRIIVKTDEGHYEDIIKTTIPFISVLISCMISRRTKSVLRFDL